MRTTTHSDNSGLVAGVLPEPAGCPSPELEPRVARANLEHDGGEPPVALPVLRIGLSLTTCSERMLPWDELAP